MKKITLLLILFLSSLTFAQVGIGTATPDNSAMLEISSNNKGVIFPNVKLLSETDATTITSPKEGLMVYNTNTLMTSGKGLYFNNGTSLNPIWTIFTKTTKYLNAYDTSGRNNVSSATPTLQPGCTINFTIPTGQTADIKIDASVGSYNRNNNANRYSVLGCIILFDGAYLPKGGYNILTVNNNDAAVNSYGVCTLVGALENVTSGTHTIQLFTYLSSGTTNIDIGGDCTAVANCGEIHATINYK